MARKKKKKWIQKAIKRPGAFTRKAKKAGKSVQAYAKQVIAKDHKRYGLTTYRQAVLARTLKKLRRKKRRKKRK